MKSLTKLVIKTGATLAALVLIVFFVWSYVLPKLSQHEQKQKEKDAPKETYLVRRVVDGDTFEIDQKEDNGKYVYVRLLGLDTPEKWESGKLDKDAKRTGKDKKIIQRLGQMASDYAKQIVEGKRVKLVAEQHYEDKDAYGRWLRYVYLQDGTLVNKKMIEDGYGNAFRKYPISKLDEFIKAENDARQKKKGLWREIEGLDQLDSK